MITVTVPLLRAIPLKDSMYKLTMTLDQAKELTTTTALEALEVAKKVNIEELRSNFLREEGWYATDEEIKKHYGVEL